MKRLFFSLLSVLASLALVACEPSPEVVDGPANSLPLLEAGKHLGMITTFELLPSQTEAAASSDWALAVSEGMRVGRVHQDWRGIETAPGVYDRDALLKPLDALHADGLAAFVGIYAIDTEDGPILPPDLDGRPLDDPEVLARYRAMLEWAVPLIVERGGYVISVGNEPGVDIFFTERADAEAVNRFVQNARDTVQAIDPKLAVTLTLTGDAVDAPYGALGASSCDVITFNYYPLDLATMQVTDVSKPAIEAQVAKMIDFAKERDVLIQELGCPAGPDGQPSKMGTSEEKQATFLRNFVEVMRATPRLRVAYWFQQVDWSAELTAYYVDLLSSEGMPASWVAGFAEWLETSGFLRFDDGSRREDGWAAFMDGQRQLRQDRASH